MSNLTQLIPSVEFLEKWQTLIGSSLGLFFAVMIPVIGFLIKRALQKKNDRKESLRRVEIAFSITLNQIFNLVSDLEGFVTRVKEIITAVEQASTSGKHVLHETNYPPVVKIYFDEDLSKMKFKSYYLHNKILMTELMVNYVNSMILQFRTDYEKLLKKNEMLVIQKVEPKQQCDAYSKNLTSYIMMVGKALKAIDRKETRSIVQAKVYNLKLKKDYRMTLLKYEWKFSKYFKKKSERSKYSQSLDSVDRIDKLMEEDVQKLFKEVEERAAKHRTS